MKEDTLSLGKMAIKAKPCHPKVIKFGRSVKKGRRDSKEEKWQKRGKKKEINKLPISAMAEVKRTIRNGE